MQDPEDEEQIGGAFGVDVVLPDQDMVQGAAWKVEGPTWITTGTDRDEG